MKVELVKGEHTRRYDNPLGRWVGESFERGERVIMVDGVRWGRTHVESHGSKAPRTRFSSMAARR